MIETFFARASSSARLLEPPLGSYLESLAQTLQGQRYSREVIRSYVHAAHRFGEWLSTQGLPQHKQAGGPSKHSDATSPARKPESRQKQQHCCIAKLEALSF
jgi:hypothetical protein